MKRVKLTNEQIMQTFDVIKRLKLMKDDTDVRGTERADREVIDIEAIRSHLKPSPTDTALLTNYLRTYDACPVHSKDAVRLQDGRVGIVVSLNSRTTHADGLLFDKATVRVGNGDLVDVFINTLTVLK